MPGIMRCMRQSCVAGAACGSLWFFINGSGSGGMGTSMAGITCCKLQSCCWGCMRQVLVFHQRQWFSEVGASIVSCWGCMRQPFGVSSVAVVQWDGLFDGKHHALHAAVVCCRGCMRQPLVSHQCGSVVWVLRWQASWTACGSPTLFLHVSSFSPFLCSAPSPLPLLGFGSAPWLSTRMCIRLGGRLGSWDFFPGSFARGGDQPELQPEGVDRHPEMAGGMPPQIRRPPFADGSSGGNGCPCAVQGWMASVMATVDHDSFAASFASPPSTPPFPGWLGCTLA